MSSERVLINMLLSIPYNLHVEVNYCNTWDLDIPHCEGLVHSIVVNEDILLSVASHLRKQFHCLYHSSMKEKCPQ